MSENSESNGEPPFHPGDRAKHIRFGLSLRVLHVIGPFKTDEVDKVYLVYTADNIVYDSNELELISRKAE